MISLLNHNTFGIDQACSALYEPTSVEELKAILPRLCGQPLLVIGGGSNLLLTKDFEGNVLHPCIKGITPLPASLQSLLASPNGEERTPPFGGDGGGVLLRCGAGEVWDEVVEYAVANGLYDMENLSLIPGEVGASAVQNIGAYGMEAKDIIERVEAVEIATGRDCSFGAQELDYAYRHSRFKAEWKGRFVITHVTYRLSRTFTPRLDYGNLRSALAAKGIEHPTAKDVRDVVIEIRREKLPDPKVEGNAGSFFMNPVVSREKFESLLSQYPAMPHYNVDATHEKIPAGWMIEQCGWKGRSLGRAGVHSRQALVLVNRGGAKGSEIVALCDAIRRDVAERFGIDIHPEVNIV